jgi:hypothetical protein
MSSPLPSMAQKFALQTATSGGHRLRLRINALTE